LRNFAASIAARADAQAGVKRSVDNHAA